MANPEEGSLQTTWDSVSTAVVKDRIASSVRPGRTGLTGGPRFPDELMGNQQKSHETEVRNRNQPVRD